MYIRMYIFYIDIDRLHQFCFCIDVESPTSREKTGLLHRSSAAEGGWVVCVKAANTLRGLFCGSLSVHWQHTQNVLQAFPQMCTRAHLASIGQGRRPQDANLQMKFACDCSRDAGRPVAK